MPPMRTVAAEGWSWGGPSPSSEDNQILDSRIFPQRLSQTNLLLVTTLSKQHRLDPLPHLLKGQHFRRRELPHPRHKPSNTGAHGLQPYCPSLKSNTAAITERRARKARRPTATPLRKKCWAPMLGNLCFS